MAFCVFAVDLDQTSNEEILLFGRGSLPVVRFRDGDNEAYITGPLVVVLLGRRGIGIRVSKRLNGRQVLEIPGFANREGAVVVLTSLVHTNTASATDSNYDDARLLVVRR